MENRGEATERPAAPAGVMDGIESDLPLFPGFESEPVEPLSADRRRTLRQQQAIVNGRHPLGGPLHPDADQTRTAESGRNDPVTCGTCRFRGSVDHQAGSYPKCFANPATITHGPATDVRAWWPACHEYQARGSA